MCLQKRGTRDSLQKDRHLIKGDAWLSPKSRKDGKTAFVMNQRGQRQAIQSLEPCRKGEVRGMTQAKLATSSLSRLICRPAFDDHQQLGSLARSVLAEC
jgi:hypothetical protein